MVFDSVSALGGWAWIIAGLALLILELLVPGVFLLWIGVAAAIVGGAVLIWPELGFVSQLGLFAAASLVTVLVAKQVFKYGALESDALDINRVGREHVGRIVVVEDAIRNGRGRVRVGDTLWNAEGRDAEQGSRVRVTAVRGTVMVVEPA